MSPLLEEMPDRAEELFSHFQRGKPVGANIVRPKLLRQASGLPPPLKEEALQNVSSHRGDAR